MSVSDTTISDTTISDTAFSDTTSTIFDTTESAVRSYARSFPTVFTRAKGEWLYAADGTRYLDFLSGAGSLNYGHNPEVITREVIGHLANDGLVHGLDLATSAKAEFLDAFRRYVLEPRDLTYRVQFCSPSGASAVEAALALACLVTRRGTIVAFGGGFHGVTSGALAATADGFFKEGLRHRLPAVTHLPYPDSPLGAFDTMDLLRRLVEDPGSGVETPAAVLLETVQGEGGVYSAPDSFLRDLRAFCDRHEILLIVDDIQAGCGRTGHFFSFEPAGIRPDLVTLAKSIGGSGLPMALLLIAPELDVWKPGQHSGTFRGNQLAFTAGAAALRHYWADDALAARVREHDVAVGGFLRRRVRRPVRGKGLMWGVELNEAAAATSRLCFERGLIVETCGRGRGVLKLLPPLTIEPDALMTGLEIIADAAEETLR
ncbi:diaminobutyrate--2-oxoglutarate transaminase [Actinomadura sp. DC4]|uniref:diaminobutyrate--2-oxoglutarate transaminase n=1 Tax=Actinomadura sp. DC4 TaxID=3055069 RepID=UPI0025AFF2B3|nr:diaminobutyrate--2-oxoglutarate transaminase [Actinomadura sp. DC4]MDN3354834.1 diaminobutyrate--2-oxoglutarate transaminase [Actinomadura sp. DC4]